MKATLLLGLAAAALVLGATTLESLCLEELAGAAQRWGERARRVPALSLGPVDHASLALPGGRVERAAGRAQTVESFALEGGPVVALAERDGVLALGLFDGGAWRIPAGGAPEQLAVDPRVNALAWGEDGGLYLATAGGAFRVDPDGRAVRLAPGAFSAVAFWRGEAWFASPRGLSVAGADGFLTRGPAQGFAADAPAALAACGAWLCAGAVDGLWLWDGARAVHLASDSAALPSDWVTALAFGPDGLWAGTFDAGLARLTPEARRVAPADGLPDGRVQPHALALRDGAAFAGTPSGIVALRGGRATLVAEGLPSPEVTALAAADAGGLWIGHAGGAARVLLEEVRP